MDCVAATNFITHNCKNVFLPCGVVYQSRCFRTTRVSIFSGPAISGDVDIYFRVLNWNTFATRTPTTVESDWSDKSCSRN